MDPLPRLTQDSAQVFKFDMTSVSCRYTKTNGRELHAAIDARV